MPVTLMTRPHFRAAPLLPIGCENPPRHPGSALRSPSQTRQTLVTFSESENSAENARSSACGALTSKQIEQIKILGDMEGNKSGVDCACFSLEKWWKKICKCYFFSNNAATSKLRNWAKTA